MPSNLGLAACRARTADRHHFHVNTVLAALAWTRLEWRHAADRALDRFSMTNVKLKHFLEMVLARLFEEVGPEPHPAVNTPKPCLNLGQTEPVLP